MKHELVCYSCSKCYYQATTNGSIKKHGEPINESSTTVIDVNLMDNIIKEFLNNKLDYLSNTIDPTFPDGLDIEVFTFNSLEIAALNAKKSFDKEHVTPFIKRDKRFKRLNYYNDIDYS